MEREKSAKAKCEVTIKPEEERTKEKKDLKVNEAIIIRGILIRIGNISLKKRRGPNLRLCPERRRLQTSVEFLFFKGTPGSEMNPLLKGHIHKNYCFFLVPMDEE